MYDILLSVTFSEVCFKIKFCLSICLQVSTKMECVACMGSASYLSKINFSSPLLLSTVLQLPLIVTAYTKMF
jgi:hypothetical protein